MFTRSANVSVFVWMSEWCAAVLCALCLLFLTFPFISFSFLQLCARRHRTVPVCGVKGSTKLRLLAQFVKATATPTETTSNSLQDDEVKVKVKVVLANDIFTSATVGTRARIAQRV